MTENPVERYYDTDPELEWRRMDRHRTEYAVSLRALGDYLPSPPAAVLDIGGGPGRYAIELARRGYTVSLADISRANLDYARGRAAEAGVQLAGYVHANALDLSRYPEAIFDAVLLMGPLYHLLELDERRRAIFEARRVLKPGGVLFAAFINRFGVFRDAAARAADWVIAAPEYAWRLLETGQHDQSSGFTRAYFAHPDEIIPLVESCGMESLALINCEGVVGDNEAYVNTLTGEAWETWMAINYRIARDPAARGLAGHLLHVGRKPVRN